MSIGLATMGMFQSCCGARIGGGGILPYRREEERVTPLIRVTKFEMKTININEQIFKNISVILVNEDN